MPGQKAVCPLFPPVLYHTALAVARLFCNFTVKIAAVNLSIFSKKPSRPPVQRGFSGPDARCSVIGMEFCNFPVKSGGQKRPGPALARVSSWGGGARDSNGEDSLFLHDCLKKGLHIYADTAVLGREVYRESTWFHGYNEKFFADRGVLYHHLYGALAGLSAMRFLVVHGVLKKSGMLAEIPFGQAYGWMREGMRKAKARK